MRSMWMGLMAAMALAAGAAQAQGLVSDRPDHVILVSIESPVIGAEVLGPAPEDGGEPEVLGRTPCVLAVELHWKRSLFGKKWKNLKVWSRGDAVSSDYDRKSQTYRLTLDAQVRAPGYTTSPLKAELAEFSRYSDVDWDDLRGIPGRVSVQAELDVDAAAAVLAPASVSRRSPATVMMAGQGDQRQFGAVTVDCAEPDAEVIVDGQTAGRTPVRLVLRAGAHQLSVQKPGFRLHQQNVSVDAEAELTVSVKLQPAGP